MAPRVFSCLLPSLLIAASAMLTACGRPADPAAAKPPKLPPLVSVVTAHAGDVAIDVDTQGHLVSLQQVQVRPQLTARIAKVHFHEGERVAAGQLLFTLESADTAAQLQRANAQLSQVQAQMDSAQHDYQRATALVNANFMAPSALDGAKSKLDALAAQQRGAHAEIDAVRVNMGFARIVAPMTARAGVIGVQPGGLAQPGMTEPLVVLVQLDPIGVEFSVPEQLLPAIRAAEAEQPIAVRLTTQDGRSYPGKLAFIDTGINRDSGTIALKALFVNHDEKLWPGSFARVTLQAGVSKQAVALPTQALQDGSQGKFVFVLDGAGRVKAQPVTLLRIQANQAIVDGVADGQRVITEGPPEQLRDGAAVRIVAALPGARQ